MNIQIDLNNCTAIDNDLEVSRYERDILRLEQALKVYLQKNYAFCASLENLELAIELCEDSKMQEINNQYRQKDKTTDVLSFELHRDLREKKSLETSYLCLGDIFISLEKASTQAKGFKIGLYDELMHLTVHGIIHLLGYDHEIDEEQALLMEREEKELLDILSSLNSGELK